ncbi:AraC family transcriptional regulator [Dongia soli]|uniref:AraC family transcriptional regulator n=1 Tax=Dongia soli TaxID=600628 RepID=A0ABU5EI66_9PROT|nr:AraC family transcriptional regulator [Dongia soli]MDY0885893.1 AraC family transcriptional regulator [Dongia soli]
MASEPLWRITPQDLDKLMATLEVERAKLSRCTLTAGSQLRVACNDAPTIHYGLQGSGWVFVNDEPPIQLTRHTLVIVPPGKFLVIAGSDHAFRSRRCLGSLHGDIFIPGSSHRCSVGEGEPSVAFVCGSFRAFYGAAVDLFASLTTPIIEKFDVHDQLDQIMNYAVSELAAEDVGGGPMSAALLKLVLLALLRRCLTSVNPWVERFSILSDPPIARAFAGMASRPSDQHTVQSLSHSVGLSRSAFMARFVVAFGESPISLLRRVRMRYAAELLAANALSIDQVALQAGYQSRSSFTRTFRRHYGSNPSGYRAEALRPSDANPAHLVSGSPTFGESTADEQ